MGGDAVDILWSAFYHHFGKGHRAIAYFYAMAGLLTAVPSVLLTVGASRGCNLSMDFGEVLRALCCCTHYSGCSNTYFRGSLVHRTIELRSYYVGICSYCYLI